LPNDWRAYWYLGAIAATEKKDSIAIHNFEQVTQLAEWNGDGWYYLGSYYFEKGNYQKTLEIMERAKRAVPKDSRLFFLYGLACAQLKKNDEAIAAYKKSLELNPNDVNTLGSLALALDGLKRFSESDSLYELALKLEPNNHLILNNYGYSLAERGLQLERALQMAKIAVESQPENPSYLDTLGWVYFKLGKFIEAEPYIVKAVNSGEASAVVLEHLGDTYSKLGVKDKAIEWWKKALEKDPENKQIQQKIARGEL
jgi:tetratricopeptide (TPR) repeat protein